MASIISAGTSTGTALNLTGDTSGVLSLASNNGTVAMTIDTAQKVGIGTASPTNTLDIQVANARVNVQSTTTTNPAYVAFQTTGYNYVGVDNSAGGGLFTGTSAYALALGTASAYPVQIATNNTVRMTVDSSGNVGIGTASPTTKLYVTSTTNRAYATVESTSTTAGPEAGISLKNGNKNFLLFNDYDSSSLNVYDATAAAFRMRIDSSGNLLVNTTSSVGVSSAKLEVKGGSSGGRPINTSVDIGTSANQISFNNTNGQVGSISTNGSLTSYNISSDRRLKDNIVPLKTGLSSILALKPSEYTYKADPSTKIQGFIADELQDIIPHAVTGEKDAVDENGIPIYQGVDASFLIPFLVKAIQEQQVLIENLTTRLSALEAK